MTGCDWADHDKNLQRVLRTNVKFNRCKIQMARSEVSYLGRIVYEHEIKPDSAPSD